jgi:hypothetical protein
MAIALRTVWIRLPESPSPTIRSTKLWTSLRRTSVTGLAAIASRGRTQTRRLFSMSRFDCAL